MSELVTSRYGDVLESKDAVKRRCMSVFKGCYLRIMKETETDRERKRQRKRQREGDKRVKREKERERERERELTQKKT